MSSIFRVLKPVVIISIFSLAGFGYSSSNAEEINVDQQIALQEALDKETAKSNVPVAPAPMAESKEKISADFEQAFSTMMKDPANIDNTMNYANLAIKLENYEAAIPALERILLFNPSLTSVKANLGVLYFNLEAYDIAKTYMEDAKKDSSASADVINKSNEYLEKIKTAKRS